LVVCVGNCCSIEAIVKCMRLALENCYGEGAPILKRMHKKISGYVAMLMPLFCGLLARVMIRVLFRHFGAFPALWCFSRSSPMPRISPLTHPRTTQNTAKYERPYFAHMGFYAAHFCTVASRLSCVFTRDRQRMPSFLANRTCKTPVICNAFLQTNAML